MPRGKKMTNKEKEQLFKKYVDMGDSRTLSGLSTASGVSLGTVNKLSANNSWRDRIEQIELKALQEREVKIKKHLKNKKLDMSKDIEEILQIHLARLKDPEFCSAKDLEILFKIYNSFMGENEETNININSNNITEIKLDKESKKIAETLSQNINNLFKEDEIEKDE